MNVTPCKFAGTLKSGAQTPGGHGLDGSELYSDCNS